MLHYARIALSQNEINRFEQARKKMARKVTTLARNSSIKVSFKNLCRKLGAVSNSDNNADLF